MTEPVPSPDLDLVTAALRADSADVADLRPGADRLA